jgi:hypothetical protein
MFVRLYVLRLRRGELADAFIGRIRGDGARLLTPGGTGIGFDDVLENLPWKSIG